MIKIHVYAGRKKKKPVTFKRSTDNFHSAECQVPGICLPFSIERDHDLIWKQLWEPFVSVALPIELQVTALPRTAIGTRIIMLLGENGGYNRSM